MGTLTNVYTQARYIYAHVPFYVLVPRISRDNPARHSGLPDEQSRARKTGRKRRFASNATELPKNATEQN